MRRCMQFVGKRSARLAVLVLVLLALFVSSAFAAAGDDSEASSRFPKVYPRFVARDSNNLPRAATPLLNGEYEVRLYNNSPFKVIVGVRHGDQGCNFALEGRATKTLWLPEGEYDVFYRFANNSELHHGNVLKVPNKDRQNALLSKPAARP